MSWAASDHRPRPTTPIPFGQHGERRQHLAQSLFVLAGRSRRDSGHHPKVAGAQDGRADESRLSLHFSLFWLLTLDVTAERFPRLTREICKAAALLVIDMNESIQDGSMTVWRR
jgi:hypothetical protein